MRTEFQPFPLRKVEIEGFEFTVSSEVDFNRLRTALAMRKLWPRGLADDMTKMAGAARFAVYDDHGWRYWPPDAVEDDGPGGEVLSGGGDSSTFTAGPERPSMTRDLTGRVWPVTPEDPAYQLLIPIPELAPRNPAWERESKKFREANPACLVCGTTTDCQVHHKYPVHLHPDKEMDPAFWRTLCRVHHLWFGHLGSWYSYNEDVDEDVKLWHEKIKGRPKGTVPAG